MKKRKKKRVRAAYPARGNMDVTGALIRCALACSLFIVAAGALSVSGAYRVLPQWASMLIQTALTVLCFGFPAVYGLLHADGDQRAKIACQAVSAQQLRWLGAAGVLLICPMTLLTDLISAPFVRMGIVSAGASAAPPFALFVPMLVKSVLIAPACEELFFRGYLTAALREAGSRCVMLISALFFALMHGVNAALVPRFLMGLLLGALVMRTDSLLAAVIVHAAYNLTVLLLSFVGLGGLFSGLGFLSCLIRVPLCAAFVLALREACEARCARRALRFGPPLTLRQKIALVFALIALIVCPLLMAG
ncbi:MAG: CPBP family intramembrane metalloprotease [Clostridia bacterium]|nr:CPBP family intramembrane metalloprotease [Clostridia bacterium]